MGQVGGSWGRCMGAGVALAVLFAAGTARAEDVVVLKNGGFSRGRIIDHDPQTGTTIALPDGTSKRFDAAEVESVKRGEDAPVTEPAPEAPRTTPVQESVQPSDGDGVFRPRVRGGVSVLGGTMIVGGSGISTAVAAALGVSGRIGVKVAPEVSLFYEPSLVMGIDSGVV